MSRIFLSHSSVNNAEAVALYDWLEDQGWKGEIFLDLDPKRGNAAGERWERRLNEAANRCEAVLFLVSEAWLASGWCRKELNLAHRLNKPLFGVLIEDMKVADVPKDISGDWQLVRLASGRDDIILRSVLPVTHEEAHVTFSREGLQRLKHGLQKAGLDPKYFAWPPESDPKRAPYRGLRPLEAEDAGIFFGRDGPIVVGLDLLRGLRDTAPPRLLVILGASGSGKSSFMRAGLLPRLAREDQHFLPLPVVRPERAALSGETGLIASLEQALKDAGLGRNRAVIRKTVEAGTSELAPLLTALTEAKTRPRDGTGAEAGKQPTLILPIDQAEELFLADSGKEAASFLELLRRLAIQDMPALIVLFTIRSDGYERLQTAKPLEGLRQHTLSLAPMPQGSYADVIKGPARRLEETDRPLKIEAPLVNALLSDIEEGGAKAALPLLAFTLERLYREHGGDGDIKLSEYEELGRVKGSIEAAVEHALKAADGNPAIPRDRAARLALLRHGLIPWLAGLDPETGTPRRHVARLSEIPAEARPLIDLLVEQRLLATDVAKKTGETTIEPAHKALLRQWGLLQGWLAEDAGLLGVPEGVKRASRDWAANNRDSAWLTHTTGSLAAAERLRERPDLASNLEPTDWEYVAACRKTESAAKWRRRAALAIVALLALIGGAWLTQDRWLPLADVAAYRAMNWVKFTGESGETFQECSSCPEMVVLPKGEFLMGSPQSEWGRGDDEDDTAGKGGDQVRVTIPAPFAVSKFEVTFDQGDACVAYGGCIERASASGWGRGSRPVINVSWNDAQQYVKWLSELTGKDYRLLTEAEWEYAARAGSATRYSFGDDEKSIGDHAWHTANSDRKTQPVGQKKPNAFGLYDMHGNVWEWVEDCYRDSYSGAPTDSSAVTSGECSRRVIRGGSWFIFDPVDLRSATRIGYGTGSRNNLGFRVGRTLTP